MIYIGLGSNKSFCGKSPLQIVELARNAIARLGFNWRCSAIIETVAWPNPLDPPYQNAVIGMETELSPGALLASLQMIEDSFGRQRAYLNSNSDRYAPRTLDLDILDYNGLVQNDTRSALILPHPAMTQREFVLRPLLEIAPNWQDPVTGQSGQELLSTLLAK
ncbi:MAG: 2-amino-4-hydroxy-6-hydroxymethyldihydropteridine diphosphokinase [bacterium]